MGFQLKFSFKELSPLLTPDEIYSSVSTRLIDELKEDRRVERKPAGIHGRELGTYHSMWANTVPDGGLVLVGVEDDGSISGCSHLSANELNEKEKAGRQYCPDARSESKRVEVTKMDGDLDFILAIRVFYREDKVVEDVSGNVFTRVGDEKQRLSDEEIRELQNDKGQVDLEQEPSNVVYPADFDVDLIKKYCDGVKKIYVNFSRTTRRRRFLSVNG